MSKYFHNSICAFKTKKERNDFFMKRNAILEVVPTNVMYTYNILMKNINELKEKYSFLEVGSVGNSVLEKEIPYVKIGNGKRKVMYHGAIHANEWITSVLLMKFIENFCIAYKQKEKIFGYDAQELTKQVSLYIVPMVNPDGVDLVTGNVEENSSVYKNYVAIAKEYKNIPFPNGWKANFNGVDLKRYQPICKVL